MVMRKNISLLLAAVLSFCLSVPASRADAVANIAYPGTEYKSPDGNSQARVLPGVTVLEVSYKGRVLYKTPENDRLKYGTVFVFNQGHNLIWMLREHFLSTIARDLDAPALSFYKDGLLEKSYSLKELLLRPKMVSASVSHIQWIPDLHDENWHFYPAVELSADGKKFKLETTSMRRYTFDAQSGAMQSADDNEVWKSSDLLVYGELVGQPSHFSFKNAQMIKGKIDKIENFGFMDPTGTYSSGYHCVALKQILGNWVTAAPEHKVSTIYNMLN